MILKSDERRFDNIIKNIPFFKGLGDEELEQVERLIVKKRFNKDQIVLYEEDTANYMYLVYAGKVRIVKMNEEGREQIIGIHKKGDFFGEMALLDGKTSPASVIAHEDVVIGFLSKEDFDQHLMCNEEIRRRIIDLLCFRLRDSWAMIKILSFDNAEHRVMAVLDRLQALYGVVDDRGIIINIKLTHQQMASYAAVARETVTRVLSRLERDGLIEVQDNKAILLNKSFYAQFKGVA